MDTQHSDITDDTTENNNDTTDNTVNDIETTKSSSATVAPDSERTNSSSITSKISIGGDDGGNGTIDNGIDETNDNNIDASSSSMTTGNISTTKTAAATAAPASERTNSSSITSSSTGNGGDTKNELTKSHVSFGSVHVHEHRMTLGTNPEVSYGVPVELAWSADASDEFATIEEFEKEMYNMEHPPAATATDTDGTATSTAPPQVAAAPRVAHRLNASTRDEIASLHHSRDSIVRVREEVKTTQEQRHDSKRDAEAINIIKEIRRQRLVDSQGTALTSAATDDSKAPMDRGNNKKSGMKSAAETTVTKSSWWSRCCP